MKNFFVTCLLVHCFILSLIPPVAAYISELQTLDKTGISKLTDEQLIDAYLDVLVEMEATKTFHTTSGFTPKQYQSYKDILKYRLNLIMEIHRRNLDLPQFTN